MIKELTFIDITDGQCYDYVKSDRKWGAQL